MRNKSKIYITCLHLMHGGVEKVITSLANAFCEHGFEVEVLCTYRLGEPAYTLSPEVKVSYLTPVKPNRDSLKSAIKNKQILATLREGLYSAKVLFLKKRTMKKAIKAVTDGIIISTRNEHSVLLSKYGKSNVRKIAQLHNDHNFNKKMINDFRSRYTNIDVFTLLTEKTTKEIEGFMKGYNSYTKCITVPNFVENPNFEEVIQKETQVIAAGRFHRDKDFACLLRIWAEVIKQRPDWKLKLVGDGELRESLKNQATQLNISKSIDFTGTLAHDVLLSEMARSSCYALTSVSETFGLVLVESMSCGTPCVSFDIRVGPEAIIDDGENGFLIPNRDEKQFAEKLIKLIDNPDLCSKMGEKAKIKAGTFFKESVMPIWIELLSGKNYLL